METSSMNKILRKEKLTSDAYLIELKAAQIARKIQPGQFVIIRIDEKGERIPLSLADYDVQKGTITIIFLATGKTTLKLASLKAGDMITDLVGPLGKPSETANFGHVILCGGGLGIAPLYPIAKQLKKQGNTVTVIIGARSESLLFYEEKLKRVSDQIYVTTDDGSKGLKGFVTDQLQSLLNKRIKIDRVVAIGPAIMMKAVADVTRSYSIKTIVSLNSICVDGTGLCGACRVEVDGKTKFTCVDGPEFDGHQVDFELLMKRLNIYLPEEKRSKELYENKE
jgi:ferredoxin--NADP+ reductase